MAINMNLAAADSGGRKVDILSLGVTWPTIVVALSLATVVLAALLWGKEGSK